MQGYQKNLRNRFLKILMIFLLGLFCNSTLANDTKDSPKFSLSLLGGAGLSKTDIKVRDLSFPYITGGFGVGGKYQLNDASSVFINYGKLSATKKCETCDADASGSIAIDTIKFGYSYRYSDLNSPMSVDFKVSKELTNHLADALGKLGSNQDTTVSIDSSSSFTRGSAGLNYHLNDDAFLTVGMGALNWNISALAKSVIGSRIRLSTRIDAKGNDKFYFIEGSFVVLGRSINLGVRQSNLTADNKSVLRELYTGISLPWGF